MPTSSLRLAFAGTPAFAVPALLALHGAGHRICGVFTQADRPAGRGRALHASAVKQQALALGLPVHQPLSFKSAEAQDSLRALAVDVFIVVAYGLILPPEALALPRLGALNIHASLLPRWRGAAPIQRALLAGDAETGITIMRMERGLDTGPMLLTRALSIERRETSATLHDRLAALGAKSIVTVLRELASGAVSELAQPAEGVTYAAKIAKTEALIDWREDAAAIERKVRAFDPWPVAETRLEGVQLRVWSATADASPKTPPLDGRFPRAAPGEILAASEAGIDVACGRGVLRILRLQLPGGKTLAAGEFARARTLIGQNLGAS